MEKVIKGTLKLRNGSSSEWDSKNPILAEGEAGYDTTKKILKIGDGTAAWNDIPDMVSASLKKVTGSGNISVTVENNTEYRYTDVTSLSITCPDGEYECWIRMEFNNNCTPNFTITNATLCASSFSFSTSGLEYYGVTVEIHIKDGWYSMLLDKANSFQEIK